MSFGVQAAKEAGAATLQQIADYMNQNGFTTRRGGQWSPKQVGRVLDRLPAAA